MACIFEEIIADAIKEVISESFVDNVSSYDVHDSITDVDNILSDSDSEDESEPIPIEWSCDIPDIYDTTCIAYYEWADFDGCPHACCNAGPVSSYELTATGINFSSFRITVERNVVNDHDDEFDEDDKNGISYIQISIDKIGDLINQHWHITMSSGYDGYNCPEALDFMKLVNNVRTLWKKNPDLSWNDIIDLQQKRRNSG